MPEIIQLPGLEVKFHRLLLKLIDAITGPYVFVKPDDYKYFMSFKEVPKNFRNCPCRGHFDRDFKSLQKRAGVPYRCFHNLRGTFATEMINAGFTVKETQGLMRHSSAGTTLKYYVFNDAVKTVKKANNFMGQNVP